MQQNPIYKIIKEFEKYKTKEAKIQINYVQIL